MKKIITLLAFVASLTSFSQEVLCSRSAPLENDGYSITGTATLEKVGNDDIKLKLSSDYSTPSGPDVRVYLSKSEKFNASTTIEIVNLATNGDFSGAKTFDVPSGVKMDEYPFILFHCLRFSASWAKGTWSEIDGVCNPTGVWEAKAENKVEAYPNPTEGELNFQSKIQNVQVFTTDGVLKLTETNVNKIDLSSLEKNTYVVLFDGNRSLITVQ